MSAVLSHLAHPHPHPQIEPIKLSEPLGGAVFISPWTWLETEYNGHEIDSRGDIVTEKAAGPWASSYVDVQNRDNYTDPAIASHEWIRENGENVRKILILAGQNEILLPLIRNFVEKFQVSILVKLS